MDDPYDFIDQYEDAFDREIQAREKVFDEPVANTPMDLVEDSITPPEQMTGSNARFGVPDASSYEQKTLLKSNISPSPLHDERFGMVGPSSENPPGLLDKPDRRDAPLNPFKYKLREKAGLSMSSSRYKSLSFGKTRGSGSSVWCKEKQEWLSFPSGCEGCDRLVDANFFGLICRYDLDWHIEVTKNFARDGKTLYFDSKDWDILRGDPEFRELVEKHDRDELEYMERSLELSERDEMVNYEMRKSVEQYREKLRNPGGLQVRPVRNLR